MILLARYRIAEMFGNGKVWQIIHGLPNLKQPNLVYKWFSYVYPICQTFLPTTYMPVMQQFTKH